MSGTPKVSIVVPSYNHRQYLAERMQSVVAQTVKDFELILLDDASSDGSADFLQPFADNPYTQLILNENNSGSPFVQWNRGLKRCRGEFVWIAESDDIATPQFLEVLTGALDEHDNVGLAFCRSNRINNEGEKTGDELLLDRDGVITKSDQFNGHDAIRRFLYLNNQICSASAVVFRRQLFLEAGGADAGLRLTGDWLQWVRILQSSDLYYVSEPLSSTRIHDDTRRGSTADNGTLEVESLRIQRYIRKHVGVDHTTTVAGAARIATSRLQGLRAARYSGPVSQHIEIFCGLFSAAFSEGLAFALRLPYALAVWFVKRHVLRRPDVRLRDVPSDDKSHS